MSTTNYNNPAVNPANAANSVTLAEGNVPSDFDFFPPDYEQTLIERHQPLPDDLVVKPRAFTDTTDNTRSAARRMAGYGRITRGGRVLHR